MHLQSVGQVHAERRLQQRHVFHQSVTPGFELSLSHTLQCCTHTSAVKRGGVHLRQLVQVSVHRALQHAPPQPAGKRVARHAEHGVGAGVGDGGSEVGHADDEAVPGRGSAFARRRRERRDVTYVRSCPRRSAP